MAAQRSARQHLAALTAPAPRICHGCRMRNRGALRRRAKNWDDHAVDWIDKNFSKKGKGVPAKAERSATTAPRAGQLGNGMLLLLVLNYGTFVADKLVHVKLAHMLPLFAAKIKWWQLLTHAFYHTSFGHLSSNMFMLWAFGSSLEANEGTFGLLAYYVLCALGAAAAFVLFDRHGVGIGASGAVFGLYVLSVGVRLCNFSFRKLLEVLAITPFVLGQIAHNVSAQVSGSGPMGLNVAYSAHLGGALAGLALVLLQVVVPADDAPRGKQAKR